MAEDVPEPEDGVAAPGTGAETGSVADAAAEPETSAAAEPETSAAVAEPAPESGAAQAQPEAAAGVADELASIDPDEGPAVRAGSSASPAVAPRARVRSPARRTLVLGAALVALVGVIVVDLVVIVKGTKPDPRPPPRVVQAPAPTAPTTPSAQTTSTTAAVGAKPVASGAFLDFDDSEQAHAPVHEHHESYRTVEEAANRSCSTKSVDGLSRQIIRQARCFDRNAFVAVPHQPNLRIKSNVYLYLEAPARAHLLRVLAANRNKTMVINSALRTVAQQYLLQKWYANRRCGITLAALPGESNHETGLALDVAEAYKWKPAMKKQHFHWLGKVDGMHFDYKGPGAETGIHADVKAFQELWNENHPKDRIPDNGRYTPGTEARLKESPAAGFRHGPRCG